MKNKDSVWIFPHSTKYYLKHPLVWFRDVYWNLKETFTLKSGNNAPDPRELLAKHDEQRERAEREAKPLPIIIQFITIKD